MAGTQNGPPAALSFLSGLAKGFGNVYVQNKQAEFEEARKRSDTITALIGSAIQSGQLDAARTKDAYTFLTEQLGGGKGKGKKKGASGDDPFHKLVDATFGASGTPQGATATQQGSDVRRDVAAVEAGAQGQPGAIPSGTSIGLPPVPGKAAPAAAQASGGLPPVPEATGSPFRDPVALKHQQDVEQAWEKGGAYRKADGSWVEVSFNKITNERREASLPGDPESYAKRPLGVSSLPGTVSGTDVVGKFPEDLTGQKTDPSKTYRYIRTADSVDPVGVYPVEAPASDQPSKDMKQRVTELMATNPGMTLEDATRKANLEARGERVTKQKDLANKLTSDYETLAGKKLTNEQKRRILDGKITRKDALTLSRGLWTGTGDKFSMQDVQKTADDLMREYGQEGSEPSEAGIPPVLGAATPEPKESSTPKSAGATTPGIPPVPTAASADKTFGKGKKLSGPAQRTVDTATTVLNLIPHVTQPILDAGAQDDNDVAAMVSTRFANYLYARGKSPAEWRDDVIQYGGAVRAFVLTGLLQGRSNQKLQDVLDQHIPNPERDTPMQIMRKLSNLETIARTAAKAATTGGTMTPAQILKMIDDLPDPTKGAGPGWDKNPFATAK